MIGFNALVIHVDEVPEVLESNSWTPYQIESLMGSGVIMCC